MTSTREFIPGLELSRRFYHEAVLPVLDKHFPGLPHAAARIGHGSEVLGFDNEMSTDHNWGPSLQIFLGEEDAGLAGKIKEALSRNLPYVFYGYSTHFAEFTLEPGTGVVHPEFKSEGPIEHMVQAVMLRAFIREDLAYDLDQALHVSDWLTFPSQKLRTLVTGAVYHDGIGELSALRERFAWYPHDVWLYLLAAGWQRISQEEHLMGRAAYVGDELGSGIIGSRLVRDLMTLAFLMERQYAPYPKWFGSAFKQLKCAPELSPPLWRAQIALTWQEREAALSEAYVYVARTHNGLGITPHIPDTISYFYGRPFNVIFGMRFVEAILAQITDPDVQKIASIRLIGSIDQFSDSTDLREDASRRERLCALYM